MNYVRVIPRDLFNESKLLKCLGQLQLYIHDNNRMGFKVEFDGEPFDICQNVHDGSIYVRNYQVYLNNDLVTLYHPLNAKGPYPMQADYHDQTYDLFNEKGEINEALQDNI